MADDPADGVDLEHARAAAAAGRRRWPEVELPDEDVAAYLARTLTSPADAGSLSEDVAAELYLACGASRGDGAALRAFEAHYLDAVAPALAHMKLGAATVDEVTQRVREKLLVAAPGQAPKLDAYAARGKLRGLVQIVATRTALDLLRKQGRERPLGDGELDVLGDVATDPALKLATAEQRAELGAAFEAAIRALDSRARNLLRLHLLDGVTLDALAAMYGVHKATIKRWLANARARVASETRRGLARELGLGPAELDSFMRALDRSLDLSIQRMLQTTSASGGA